MAALLPGWPGVTFRPRKTTKSLAVLNRSWPGPPRTFSSWSRTPENTPRQEVGVLLNSKTANLTLLQRSKPASRATTLSKLVTLYLPATRPDAKANTMVQLLLFHASGLIARLEKPRHRL